MSDKNQNQNKDKDKDDCPLCQVSKETLNNLEKSNSPKKPKQNNWFKKVGLIVLALVFVLSLFGIYKLLIRN